jgi:hypothetical protein
MPRSHKALLTSRARGLKTLRIEATAQPLSQFVQRFAGGHLLRLRGQDVLLPHQPDADGFRQPNP